MECEHCGRGQFLSYAYVPDDKGGKHPLCKKCFEKTNELVAQGKVFFYDNKSKKIIIVDKQDSEIRKKCNVCNYIFCYTNLDVMANKEKAKNAKLSAVAGLGGILGGDNTTGAVYNSNAQNQMNGIVDYSRCPQCGSVDLKTLSKEEYQLEIRDSLPASPADELKKYKELLDEDVITQEEFDVKKKQLLGL